MIIIISILLYSFLSTFIYFISSIKNKKYMIISLGIMFLSLIVYLNDNLL